MPSRRKDINQAAVDLGRLGGKARAAKLTPEERSKLMRELGKQRMANLTPGQRAALSRKAVKARWGKKKPKASS